MIKIEEAKKNEVLMDQFVQENIGLVRAAIKKLGLDMHNEDYFQEGCIGLIEAIRNFNPKYGTKFSTYAVPMIQGRVKRYLRDYQIRSITGIKVSRELADIYLRYKRLHNKGMTDEEICTRLGITRDKLDYARQAMQGCMRLDADLPENRKRDKPHRLSDIIPSDISVEDEALENAMRESLLEQLFERLNERENRILHLYLQGSTQEKIAQIVGVSQAQVSRILRNIIEKGRRIAKGGVPMRKPKITDEQLLAECREHGTDEEAFEKIAAKYSMAVASVKNRFYRSGIKDILSHEEEKTTTVKEPAPVKKEPIKWYQDRTVSYLKVKAWEGKECTYTFEEGKLIISTKDGMISIEDYKTMLLEIRELVGEKETGKIA
ncbi:MAG: sigma-70 family RNA polymerase sigma factor [Archaeoglobus sp.]|nr:sigma-70 family RNA polymerase sigma factor [Archaeoglobus sp.]